jgi:hypothetical protein
VFVAIAAFFIPPYVSTMPFSWFMAIPLLILPGILCLLHFYDSAFHQFYAIYGASKIAQSLGGFFFVESCFPMLTMDMRQILAFILPFFNGILGVISVIKGLKDANYSHCQR